MAVRKQKINNRPLTNNHSAERKPNGRRFQFKFRINFRTILLVLLLFFFIGPFLFSLTNNRYGDTIPLSTAITDTKAGKIDKIKISGDKLILTYKAGEQKVAIKESSESFTDILKNSNIDPASVSFSIEDQLLSRIWVDVLGILLPLAVMGLFFLFIFRQARGAQDSLFSFGKSGARIFAKGKQNVTFKDVAGVDEAKKELEEVVDFLKNPGKYKAIGARTPKGVLMVGPSGTGKCISGDSVIWTNKGLMEIKDVPRYYYVNSLTHEVHGAALASVDVDNIWSEDKFASHWFDLGEQETINIDLRNGFSLEGTLEHPVVMMGKDGKLRFRKLDDLQVGDWVALQYGRQMFGNLQIVDRDTAYLMGLLTGDGNLSHASRVGLTSVDPEIIDFFRNYVTTRYSKSAITAREQSYLVANWDFKRYLYQMGMSYLLSFDKTIPPTILQATKEVQVAFLRGLFDTDASVEKTRRTIEYTTVSAQMVRQVQMMLLNLGVVVSLTVKGKPENGYYRDVYRLTITGAALTVFAREVGFGLSRKQGRLEDHLRRVKMFNTNVDVIPGVGSVVESSWRELSRRKLSNKKLSKMIDKVRRRTRISRQVLGDYISYVRSLDVEVPHIEYLRSLFEANFFFSPVVEKKESFARVYDFTVPETHSFLGNGFVNHNTLLAKAVAGEAGVPFFSMAGSEFMEMLVGVGASVTGDTPILIKNEQGTELLPISRFVDSFFKEDKEGLVKVENIQTLGFDSQTSGFWGYKNGKMLRIVNSAFKNITAVFRHKAQEIYEIHYLGGIVKTTADHSVFIRSNGRILPVATKDIKKGDLLVELPLNIRLAYQPDTPQKHKIVAHKFLDNTSEIELDVWNDNQELVEKYQFALANSGMMSQYAIASQVGVSQATVGNWQRQIHLPRLLSKKRVKLSLPEKTKVTPSLLKLFGYYTAEGRGTTSLEFTFGVHETDLHKDVATLMLEIFGVYPKFEKTQDNTLRIKYYSAHLGRFFAKYCGNGSHNKHVPEFIWDLPKEYFLSFLEGYWEGDGYQSKSGKLCASSVSKRLILELSWLCSMHGMKVGIKHENVKGGRVIKNKPLPDYECWTLIIGKTTNPFLSEKEEKPFQFKRAIVQKIVKKPYKGYVYDLCGIENEAFFGGEKPVLLHNSRVRDLFATAKKAAPSIIFIDEIDAIGRQRGFGLAGGHDEREQTLNQILVEMDGFTPNDNTMVVAATNRGDLLDPALLRPGRFDRRVTLDMPDKEGRLAILKIHARGKKFTEDVNWERVASRTVGFSGADLENMLNEAAILAARENKKGILTENIEEAATKVKLGPAKRRLQSDEDKRITAYHESGHALVTHNLPQMDPVHRISIVARGMSLGHTLIPPAMDRSHETRTRLLQQITAMLGGRAAEQLIFGEMTTGASNDISNATNVARRMVMDFGMSKLGPVNWGPQYDADELGRTRFIEPLQVSPKMQEQVDQEVKNIIEACYTEAVKILKRGKRTLDAIADTLAKKETLDREDFEEIVGKKPTITRPAFNTLRI
ncbi:MAG: ATP-dependent zinc metalloprotease FtsH [Candidatus Blackburnbacteria bacterium]|nr:ATP-dependent zinc metalloprotease FtsH [Candidatus Blackburnbacteria bacterium]